MIAPPRARHSPWRGLLVPALSTAVMLAVLIGLGTWQLQRLAWKDGLIAARTAALAAPAVDIGQAALDDPAWEYRHVRATGRFDHAHELYLMSRFHGDQPGIDVVTPLALDDGRWLLVDRGWVPTAAQDPARRSAGQVPGRVTVTGIIRRADPPGWFTPANDPGRNQWFTPDPGQMAAALGLDRVLPVLVKADATPVPGGLPIGGDTPIDLPNNHRQYALTWFALAVVLGVVFALYCHRKLQARPIA